jgi:hypothetical protein
MLGQSADTDVDPRAAAADLFQLVDAFDHVLPDCSAFGMGRLVNLAFAVDVGFAAILTQKPRPGSFSTASPCLVFPVSHRSAMSFGGIKLLCHSFAL